MKNINVALIGFFGVGAFSDDLIEYTTRKLLLERKPNIKFNTRWRGNPYGEDAYKLLNRFDMILQAGGSLLGKCQHFPIRNIVGWHDRIHSPLTIFGAGYRYEPDKEPLSAERRRVMTLLFETAAVASVRGYRTIYHMKRNDLDVSRIHSVADPVMACDIKLDVEPEYIMGNVRNTPDAEVKHASDIKTQRLMAEIYDWLIDYYDLPLVLISFRNVDVDSDVVGAKKTSRLMKHKDRVSIRKPLNFMEAVQHMKNAAFWFGQRLHPTIFAGINEIPFVGVEYQFEKMMDWAGTVNIDNYIHTDTATLNEFIIKFEAVSDNMRRLKEALPMRIRKINEVADEITALM